MRAPFLALIVSALAACSLTEVPPPPSSIAINECEEDGDCNGASCVRGACVVDRTSLDDVLIEISPPATAEFISGLAFYTTLDTSGPKEQDINIGIVAGVTGKITTPDQMNCVFEGPPPDKLAYRMSAGTIPVNLTFTPSERVLGVAAAAYTTVAPRGDWSDGKPYQFGVDLPPGDYDLYVEPRPPVDGNQAGCKFPPFLLRGQTIDIGAVLDMELPEARELALTVELLPGDRSVAGWTVDMLDSRSGRALSTREVLTPSATTSAESVSYQTTLVFIPAHVVRADGTSEVDDSYAVEGFEIIRLSPPEGVVAPSFLFQRDGLGISDPSVAVIDLRLLGGTSNRNSAFPPNVTLEGQTAELGSGAPVEATVTLNAKFEDSDGPAYFVRTFKVDATGRFSIEVPEGLYQVRAVPRPGSELAAAQEDWLLHEIPGQAVLAGNLIEFPKAPVVSGVATISHVGGSPFGATANATVSPFIVQATVLDLAGGVSPAFPRASTDIVSRDGRFDLRADPGTYDVYIQPEARSRYPWFVRPGVVVASEALTLAPVRLSLPVIYHGKVLYGATGAESQTEPVPVPGALVRAYARVTGKPTPQNPNPMAVIPIAEARANENGAFELLIPASLDSGQ